MGPTGFRDIHLKQFVNRMRREGYDLYHNPHAPGWRWTWDEEAEIYQLEDAANLPDYVEQLPPNDCEKAGVGNGEGCPFAQDASNEKPDAAEKGNFVGDGPVRFQVSPTIVYNSDVSVKVDFDKPQSITWMVMDAFGNQYQQGTISDELQHFDISIDATILGRGVYTIVSDLYGPVGRFVKM